jgi:ABC-2 type transport system permease protein
MWKRIAEIVKKELRQALREPRMRILLFLPPLLQLIIFGYAVNMDVERSPMAWMDRDATPASRELLEEFTGSGHFQVVATPANERDVQELLDYGWVHAVVRVPPGFSHDLEGNRTATVQVLLDGSNSNTASIVSGYAASVIAGYSARRMGDRQRARMVAATVATGEPASAAVPTLQARTRVWFNPDLRSRNYYVPGVVVNIITLVTLMLTAMAIVREKEIGTMEQLLVTPIQPLELMLGKTLPFAGVGMFQVTLVTAAALLVFHIPFRGQAIVLLAGALLFLLTTLGAGLFISTVCRTQQQAIMGSFFFFMPAFMLSGFAFPIRSMPLLAQALSRLDPVRYFMEIVRGIFLKGIGIRLLWPQMLALAAIGVGVLTVSSLRFHKRLD